MSRPILFVDNQDSFVWNLVDYVSRFHEDTAVEPNTITPSKVREMDPVGIVISPGPGHPAKPRDIGSCLEIITGTTVPLLGICLGHQAINLAFGGTIGHVLPLHGKASPVIHDGQGIFRGLESPLLGGRYHSLAVDRLAPCLRVTARSEDGIVMGLVHESLPINGLQFHPESVLTPDGMRIISNWMEGLGV